MDFIQKTVQKIEPIDDAWLIKAKKRLDSLTKPVGSMGRLEGLAQKICAITQKDKPTLKNKTIFTLAGDHGITKEGVSAYPSEVTPQMVLNFLNGGAGINVLARAVGARVVIVDMGVSEKLRVESAEFRDRKVNYGTKNFAKEPAMSREEAIQSIEIGIQLVEDEFEKGLDIVGTGDMGIGNTTSSSAITAVVTGKEVAMVTGQGTGINLGLLQHKIQVIEKALTMRQPDPKDPIDVLSKVGGFEIAGLAGVIIGSARYRIPIVLDGFISGAAALIAMGLCPEVCSYLIAGHRSAEPGHDAVLKYLGLSPLLNLKLRLGEGTGAALAMHLTDAACKILSEMATFEEAKVSHKLSESKSQLDSKN